MRKTKLIAAFTAAAALAAPVGASAATPHNRVGQHTGPCGITLYTEPHQIVSGSGEQAQLFGRLRCPAEASGVTVTFYERPLTGKGFTPIGTTTTLTGGFYNFVPPVQPTENAAFYAATSTVRSPLAKLKIAPQVTVSTGLAEGANVETGPAHSVTFTGTVSPADKGAQVVLQRENATSKEEWVEIQKGTVGAGGAYKLVHIFRQPGDANLRTVVRPYRPITVRGISNTLSYEISQAENPNLTIKAEKEPVPYGTAETITGVAKAGEGVTLSLLGKTHGGKFTVLQTTKTGSGGTYSFTVTPVANAPQPSTLYQVASATVKSSQLYYGVRYDLTVGTTPTSVIAGQSLAVTGSITPVVPGKIVYLERQNAFGGGWHVVTTEKVGLTGTFTLSWPLFGTGKGTFRVKVPGDPTNQGVSSTPFSVEILPAIPGELAPSATAPKLPTEGTV